MFVSQVHPPYCVALLMSFKFVRSVNRMSVLSENLFKDLLVGFTSQTLSYTPNTIVSEPKHQINESIITTNSPISFT